MNEFFNRAYNNASLWKIDPRATGEQLYRYRRKNNLTQEDLSGLIDACGKSASRVIISKWENGSKTPSLLHLVFLAGLYRCSLDELIVTEQRSHERDGQDQPVPLEIIYIYVLRRMYAIAYVRLFYFVNLRFLGIFSRISIIAS